MVLIRFVQSKIGGSSVPFSILRVCVLENRLFLGTRIDQKISAHDFIDDAQLQASSSCANQTVSS
jgi:hypothetical protein